MKAGIQTAIDTLWSNQVIVSVEAELDNPHVATTRHLATLMTETLHIMVEEVRSDNERAALTMDSDARERALDEREGRLNARESQRRRAEEVERNG